MTQLQQNAEECAERVLVLDMTMQKRMKKSLHQQIKLVWSAADPQSILDKMGNKAAAWYSRNHRLQLLLVEQCSDFKRLTPSDFGYSVLIRNDGTLTTSKDK